jgi:uncharacterized protein involved in exopolysaccharide biosynthesis
MTAMNADELREKISALEKSLARWKDGAFTQDFGAKHPDIEQHEAELASLRKQLEELTESKP